MSRETIESDIQMIMGEDPLGNGNSPSTSGSIGGSNNLDLSSRTIAKFRAEFVKDNSEAKGNAKRNHYESGG